MKKVLTFVHMLIAATCSNTLGYSSQREPKHIFFNEKVLVGAAISGGAFSFYRNLVYIPTALINRAHNEGWLLSLSYFIMMKSLFKNNTFYNYTLRSFARKLGCSPATLGKHIKVLEKEGVIRFHSNNLTFVGLKRLKAMFGRGTTGVKVDFKNQLDLLRGKLVQFNLQQQEYRSKKLGIQMCQHGDINLCDVLTKEGKEKAQGLYIGLSVDGVGAVTGLSRSSGWRLRNKLSRLKIFKVNKKFASVENVSLKHYYSMKVDGKIPFYAKYEKGKVYFELRSAMTYCDKPEKVLKGRAGTS